jgi:hypothetical protein
MSDETETLLGGRCDGEAVVKTNLKTLFAGYLGDGVINVYERGRDGRLRFARLYRALAMRCELASSAPTIDLGTIEVAEDKP